MTTPHIQANPGDIASTVLLPGDPLRAKYIADHFLDNPVCFNTVRNMLGYTGTYKGIPVSVMGTGMGTSSMGIYSHELIHQFGVKNLIRIGSCGTYDKTMNLFDIVLALGASTDTSYATQHNLPGTYSATCSYDLLEKAVAIARGKDIPVRVEDVLTSEFFYHADPKAHLPWVDMGIAAAEMETYALYCNAKYGKVKALTILTVSDSIVEHTAITPEERETGFNRMVEIALEVAL